MPPQAVQGDFNDPEPEDDNDGDENGGGEMLDDQDEDLTIDLSSERMVSHSE